MLQPNHTAFAVGHDSQESSESSSSMGAVLAGIIDNCAGTCSAVTPSEPHGQRDGGRIAEKSMIGTDALPNEVAAIPIGVEVSPLQGVKSPCPTASHNECAGNDEEHQ